MASIRFCLFIFRISLLLCKTWFGAGCLPPPRSSPLSVDPKRIHICGEHMYVYVYVRWTYVHLRVSAHFYQDIDPSISREYIVWHGFISGVLQSAIKSSETKDTRAVVQFYGKSSFHSFPLLIAPPLPKKIEFPRTSEKSWFRSCDPHSVHKRWKRTKTRNANNRQNVYKSSALKGAISSCNVTFRRCVLTHVSSGFLFISLK